MCTVQRISCGFVNCYLLMDDAGAILIDTANPHCSDLILRQLGNVSVNLIVLTHGHSDHVGSAAELSQKLHAPVAMHEADTPLITAPASRKLQGHTLLGRVLAGASQSVMAKTRVSPFVLTVPVDEGFDLSAYGVRAHVVALPGHTAGSIGVLTNTGDIIVGDAAFHMLRPTGARIYEDRKEMEASVEKIRRLCTGSIYVGHGNPIRAVDL